MPDDTQTIGKNGKFIGMAEMPVDVLMNRKLLVTAWAYKPSCRGHCLDYSRKKDLSFWISELRAGEFFYGT